MPPARVGSIEHLLHRQGADNKYLLFHEGKTAGDLGKPLPHRAIGVVYDPLRERLGNYVPSVMPERYDAFIYIDETTALHPLHLQARGRNMPDTYPFGV